MQTQTILLLVIQILLQTNFLSGNVLHDGILINYKKRSPKHFKNLAIIGLCVAVPAILFTYISKSILFSFVLLSYPVLRWFLHDPLLNMDRGLDPLYVGKKKDKY
jgi:hypothetical protein